MQKQQETAPMCNESSHKVIRFPEGFSRSKLLTPISLLVRGRSPIALLTVRDRTGAILHSRLDLGKGMLIDGIPGKYRMQTCKRLVPKIVAHHQKQTAQ